jgi:hypothetical protein
MKQSGQLSLAIIDRCHEYLGQSQWDFIRVSWALNVLMWHRIIEVRDDKSFMGV